MNETDATEAQCGALLLDADVPGWGGRIDEAKLDLGSCDDCVLGQVYGSYSSGCSALRLDTVVQRERHGFTLYSCDDDEWDALAAAWLVEIRARLAPSGAAAEDPGLVAVA